ncbi:MAG: dienelactone hydrolase family protein [Pseudomonadota bacterium]
MTTPLARRTLIAGLPLAAILADPMLAAEAAATLVPVSTQTASGKAVKAFVAKPAKKAPAVVLIHEWWGLNDQIKAVAADLSEQGYMALCADLYDGRVTSDASQAGAWMEKLDPKQATETLVAWIEWLRKQPDCNGKVATLGWCMGGGWSLNASIADPVDATVIYYGRVDRPAKDLAKLKGPVLGQFATRDQWINKPMVEGFVAAMKKAGKKLEIHWYQADHAFANPTGKNYQRPETQQAWKRTLDFLKANLG